MHYFECNYTTLKSVCTLEENIFPDNIPEVQHRVHQSCVQIPSEIKGLKYRRTGHVTLMFDSIKPYYSTIRIECCTNSVLHCSDNRFSPNMHVRIKLSLSIIEQDGVAVMLFNCFRKMPGSSLGWNTTYPHWCTSWFFWGPSGNCLNSISSRPPPLPSESFPIHHSPNVPFDATQSTCWQRL